MRERPKQQEKKKQQPTAEHFARLLYYSFKFSQGDPDTQDIIFEYLHATNPGYSIKNGQHYTIISILFKKTKALILGSSEHIKTRQDNSSVLKEQNIFAEVKLRLSNLRKALIKKVFEADLEKIIENLFNHIITLDYNFLNTSEGRHKVKDKWYSYFVHHVLLSKISGMEEYDRMFADIKERYKEYIRINGQLKKMFMKLIGIHNSRYPNEQINPETFEPVVV